ncbi:MAG: hypothetical protein RL077_1615 [Verrucomicrobiota bacterium]
MVRNERQGESGERSGTGLRRKPASSLGTSSGGGPDCGDGVRRRGGLSVGRAGETFCTRRIDRPRFVVNDFSASF